MEVEVSACVNCGANPATDSKVTVHRINEFGVQGEWLCGFCLFRRTEKFEGKSHFVHSPECPNYCDYSCNKLGFIIAEQINKHLWL